MTLPGEKLLIKMWGTLAERGIGGLLRPWQIRRDSKARAEAKREEMLIIASAELEVSRLKESKPLLLSGSSVGGRIDPVIDPGELLRLGSDRNSADNLRREINVARAVLVAEDVLGGKEGPEPEASIEDDWLFKWRDAAANVTDEKIRILWGKLLAGEIQKPGSFSLRTLEFIKSLSKAEAELISRIGPFVSAKYIFRDAVSVLESAGVSFAELLELQEMGVLTGVDAIGLTSTWNSSEDGRFVTVLPLGELALLVTNAEPKMQLKLPVYHVSSVGRQVLSLGTYQSNEAYAEKVGLRIKENGFNVDLGVVSQGVGEIIHIRSSRRL